MAESIKKKTSYKSTVRIEAIAKVFSPETFDVVFAIQKGDKQKISAHKALLSAASPVFAAMFNDGSRKDKQIKIVDATPAALNEFLQFFYKDNVELTEENIVEVLKLSNEYKVDKAIQICSAFLVNHLSMANVLSTFREAYQCEHIQLKGKCEEFIRANKSAILKSKDLLQCDAVMLGNIVKLNSSTCEEEIVFDACIKWAQNACKMTKIDGSDYGNLRAQLADAFNMIQFNKMDQKAFASRYASYKDMFTRDEADKIFLKFTSTGKERRKTIPKAKVEADSSNTCDFGKIVSFQQRQAFYYLQFRLTHGMFLKEFDHSNVWHVDSNGKKSPIPFSVHVKITREKDIVFNESKEIKLKTVKNSFILDQPLFIDAEVDYRLLISSSAKENVDDVDYVPQINPHVNVYTPTEKVLEGNIKFIPYNTFGDDVKNGFSTIISSLKFEKI